MSAKSRRSPSKPWSMKWIVMAIVLFIAGSTWVNLRYRKPGASYRPYQDAQDRATTVRLLDAGWQKITVEIRRPAENADVESAAVAHHDYLGVGPDLESKFAEKPALLASIDKVVAPNSVLQGSYYSLYFTASLPDLKDQVGYLTLYRKENELVLIPTIEPLPGKELMSRWTDSNYWVGFSTNTLPLGKYEMRIVAKGPASVWNFTVR
ncbi:MAG TPA: hypothetical protein VGM64_12570 [Lacunisphaera sp.]